MTSANASPDERRFVERRLPRTSGPRKVRHGLKLQSSQPAIPATPLAQRWMQLMQGRFAPETLATGLEYARLGQIMWIQPTAGGVDAHVQGRSAKPHAVALRIPALEPAQWHRIVEAMSAEAVYLAKLLAGELPPSFLNLLASLELPALPDAPEMLVPECTCGYPAPCKHAAAVGYLIGEQLDRQPLLILEILGLPAERLVERLRQARKITTSGAVAAHGDAPIPEAQITLPPLEVCIEDYWLSGPKLREVQNRPPPHHVPHALLRCLGPPTIAGRFPMVGLLASVYDVVSAAARRMRDGTE